MTSPLNKYRNWLLVVSSLFLVVLVYVGLSGPAEVTNDWGPVTLKACTLNDDKSAATVALEAENTADSPAAFAVDVGVFYDSSGRAETQIGEKSFNIGGVEPGAVAKTDGEVELSPDSMVDTYGYKCAIVDVRQSQP